MKNTNNADNITVQQNNEEWWKGTTLILGESTISGRKEKKMSRNRKIKVRYFPGAKIKDMYHYAIPLLEKKRKISSYILVQIMPLINLVIIFWKIWLSWRMDFILGKLPSCKKITLSSPTVSTYEESAMRNNEVLTNRLKEQGIPYITHDDIIHKHLYLDSLNWNSVRFSVLTEKFLSYIRGNWLQIETQNQRKNNEANSSEIITENSDDIIDGLKTLRLKYPQNPIIAQVNINSIRNRFRTLVSLVTSTSDIDIRLISETKIDESFPLSQFMIDGFSMPYRRDRNAHGGGILVYFRNNITWKFSKWISKVKNGYSVVHITLINPW